MDINQVFGQPNPKGYACNCIIFLLNWEGKKTERKKERNLAFLYIAVQGIVVY